MLPPQSQIQFQDGARVPLLDALEYTAIQFGRPAAEGRVFYERFPRSIQTLEAEWISGAWYYKFWDGMYKLKSAAIISSGFMRPVVRLCRAANTIMIFLGPADQQKVFSQLGNPEKHEHFMEELVPLSRLKRMAKVNYEVCGEGGKRVEFLINCPGETPILLEVKHRETDLVQFMEALHSNGMKEDFPPPRAELLFRSVVEKLPESNPVDRLQGVWISVNVRHNKVDLHKCSDAIDARLLHFAIIATSEDSAYILGRTEEIERFVRDFFQLRHNPEAVL